MFEFYFQSGEFASDTSGFWDFVKNLIVQIAGTAGGVYGAFWLYKRQTREQSANEHKKKSEEAIDKLLFFNNLLNSSIKATAHLQEGLNQVIEKLESDRSYIDDLPLASMEDLRRLVFEIHREAIFHAYRVKIKKLNIQQIFNCIDSLYSVSDNTIKLWREAASRNTERRNKIIELVNLLFNDLHKLNVEQRGNPMVASIHQTFLAYFANFDRSGPNYEELDRTLLEPILLLFSENGNQEQHAASFNDDLHSFRGTVFQTHNLVIDLINKGAGNLDNLQTARDTLAKINRSLVDYLIQFNNDLKEILDSST